VTRRLTFDVLGVAQPKGSAQAFVPKSWADQAHRQGKAPRAIVTSDNPRSKGWQQLVAEQAQTVAGGGPFLGPTVLTVTFYLPRPVSLPQKIRHHLTLPDLDKLVRCIGDALTGVLYLDDKQVVDLHARKCYAAWNAVPRVRITLEDAAPAGATDVLATASLFDEVRP
jgi:Holliday junction resolvase RusA-like endonuclease